MGARHLMNDLRERGQSAPAEILSINFHGEGHSPKSLFHPNDPTASWTLARLTVLVKPDGAEPFEATLDTKLYTFKTRGSTVPVLYDPRDHRKVVVDQELDLQQQTDAAQGKVQQPSSQREVAALDPELEALFDQDAGKRAG
jgi:hypothetical protein